MPVSDAYEGKVDRVPGVMHVTTRFVRSGLAPVLPRESYVVNERLPEDHPQRMIDIGYCPRSWAAAWLRWVWWFAAILLVGFVCALIFSPPKNGVGDGWWFAGGIAAVVLVVGLAISLLARPTPARVAMLARKLGIPADDFPSPYDAWVRNHDVRGS